MRRDLTSQIRIFCDEAPQGRTDTLSSGKVGQAEPDAVPEFVSRALALGYDETETWALWRQIAKTGRDVRARRITPAGGARRVDRLALAVAIVKAAGIAP
jgi:hypothetical protein